AIVFDVADRWAEIFETLHERGVSLTEPDWYIGTATGGSCAHAASAGITGFAAATTANLTAGATTVSGGSGAPGGVGCGVGRLRRLRFRLWPGRLLVLRFPETGRPLLRLVFALFGIILAGSLPCAGRWRPLPQVEVTPLGLTLFGGLPGDRYRANDRRGCP